jgi:hypothetical protein
MRAIVQGERPRDDSGGLQVLSSKTVTASDAAAKPLLPSFDDGCDDVST